MRAAPAGSRAAVRQRDEADLALSVLLVSAWIGILRFHPKSFPIVVSVYWADALVLAMGALWLLYTGGIRWTPVVRSVATFGLLFLVLITTAILGSSMFPTGEVQWPENAIQAFRFVAYGCTWIFLADVAVRSRTGWERIAARLMVAAVLVNVMVAAAQLLNLPALGPAVYALWGDDKLRPLGATTPRVYGTFFNSNWFGVFAAWCATYAVASRGSVDGRSRSLWVLVGVLFMLLVSGSRTGLLTTVFGVAATLLALAAGRYPPPIALSPRRVFTFLLLAAVAVWGMTRIARVLPIQSLLRRFLELQALLTAVEGGEVMSFSARLATWQNATDIFLESPLFGVGGSTATWGFNAHNGYLVMLMFFGLLGAVALTFFVVGVCYLSWRTLRRGSSSRRLRAWFIGFTAALALAMMVGDFIFTSQVLLLWFLLLALVAGEAALEREIGDVERAGR